MSNEPFEISESESKRAWATFPNSLMQKVLHNAMLVKIRELHTNLETAKPEDLLKAQAEVKAAKHFLGLLHRNDTLPTK